MREVQGADLVGQGTHRAHALLQEVHQPVVMTCRIDRTQLRQVPVVGVRNLQYQRAGFPGDATGQLVQAVCQRLRNAVQ